MRINHNVAAQLTNVHMRKTERGLSASLERLSSGYKINKAADDSAGLAISNKMRTQIRTLQQSSRNADEGQSIIQTAEGALSEIHSMLQRCRELSVQAANDTYTLDDRENIQKEIDKLMDEVDRIAETTEYNGKGLLDGTFERTVTSDAYGVNILSTNEKVPAGMYEVNVTAKATAAQVTGLNCSAAPAMFTINDVPVEINQSDSTEEIRSKIQETCNGLGLDANVDNLANVTITSRVKGSQYGIRIENAAGPMQGTPVYGTDATAGITIGSDEGNFPEGTVVSVDGEYVTMESSSGFKMVVHAAEIGDANFTVYEAGPMEIQVGANEHQTLLIEFPKISCETLGLREADGDDKVNMGCSDNATRAIDVFNTAIGTISDIRSQLGAYENRLESTISSLDVSSENMTEAMSRIIDTDMAAEMTEYTQKSVLSQAATSILAQANNRPQQIMSLIQS